MPDFFSFLADPQARRRLMAGALDDDTDNDTLGGLLGPARDDGDVPVALGLLSAPSAPQRLPRGLLGNDDDAAQPFAMDELQTQLTGPMLFSAPQDTPPFSQLLQQISLQNAARDDRAADVANDSPPTSEQSQAMFRQMERGDRQRADTGATSMDYRDDDQGLFGAALRAAGGDRQRALAILDAWTGSGGFTTDRNGSPVVSDGQSLPWVGTALSADALAQAVQCGALALSENSARLAANAQDERANEIQRLRNRSNAAQVSSFLEAPFGGDKDGSLPSRPAPGSAEWWISRGGRGVPVDPRIPGMTAIDTVAEQERAARDEKAADDLKGALSLPFNTLSQTARAAGMPSRQFDRMLEAEYGLTGAVAAPLAGFETGTARPAFEPEGWKPVAEFAPELRSFAEGVESKVTPALQDIAQANGGRMVGLEARLKSEGSLGRKLMDFPERPINDALRYTMSFEPGSFSQGVRGAMRSMEDQGYQLRGLNNSFRDGAAYKGINATYAGNDGLEFELQFHTPDSFAMKDVVNHPFYEQQRLLDESNPQWELLKQQMIQNSSRVPNPPAVEKIKSVRRPQSP